MVRAKERTSTDSVHRCGRMKRTPIITSIRGTEAAWPEAVKELWCSKVEAHPGYDQLTKDRAVTRANYYTPRPYVNEYNRGSYTEGFTFIVGRQVYVHEWTPPVGANWEPS